MALRLEVGDVWLAHVQRKSVTGDVTQFVVTLDVQEQIVMSGGAWYPGVVIREDEQSAQLDDFEAECLSLSINEGGVLEDSFLFDEEAPGSSFSFKTILQPN